MYSLGVPTTPFITSTVTSSRDPHPVRTDSLHLDTSAFRPFDRTPNDQRKTRRSRSIVSQKWFATCEDEILQQKKPCLPRFPKQPHLFDVSWLFCRYMTFFHWARRCFLPSFAPVNGDATDHGLVGRLLLARGLRIGKWGIWFLICIEWWPVTVVDWFYVR